MPMRYHPPRGYRVQNLPPVSRMQIRASRSITISGIAKPCCVRGCQILVFMKVKTKNGASEEIRTLDIHLGKVTLYP